MAEETGDATNAEGLATADPEEDALVVDIELALDLVKRVINRWPRSTNGDPPSLARVLTYEYGRPPTEQELLASSEALWGMLARLQEGRDAIGSILAADAALGAQFEAVPALFQDGHTIIHTTHPIFALINAINDGRARKGWDDFGGQRPPTHTTRTGKSSKEPGAVYVTVRGQDGALSPDAATLGRLWQQVGQLDILTSDVLLICLAACAKAGGVAWMSVDAFLDARGIKRIQKRGEPGNWQHGHRTEDRRDVGRALDRLESLWIEMERVEVAPEGKRRKGKRFTLSSRALVVSSQIAQEDLAGESVLLGARIRLGDWAEAYRSEGIKQLGLLAQKALAYDPYRNEVEKRLAIYLTFHYKYNPKSPAIRRKVSDLLDVAAIDLDPSRPQRVSDRLDKALNRLQSDGIIASWSPLLTPESRPARGWFDLWLKSMIEFEPPALVRSRYAAIRN